MKIGQAQNIKQFLQENVSRSRQQASKGQANANLTVGQLLKGKVLSVAVDGRVLLSVGDKNFTAQSLIALQPGQEVWLEVLEEKDVPLLGLAARKGSIVNLLTQLSALESGGVSLSRVGGFSNLSTSLVSGDASFFLQVEQFVSLFSKSVFGADASFSTVLNSLSLLGLFGAWRQDSENDDEPILPLFSPNLATSFSGTDVFEVLGKVEGGKEIGNLISLFEAFGQLNNTATESGQLDFLLFPCFFQGECGWGEWLLNFDRGIGEEGEASQKYGLTFFLEMSNLGEVYLQINLDGDALQGTFSVEDEEAKAFIDENLAELTEILTGLGFGPVTFTSQVATVSNVQSLKNSLSQGTRNAPFGLLNLTV